MGDFYVDYSLCRLAAIAISKHLLKYPKIKHIAKLYTINSYSRDKYLRDVTPVIITTVMEHFIVPEPVKEELILAGATMATMICFFIERMKTQYRVTEENALLKFSELSNYVDHICWTGHGSFDYSNTVRSLYISEMLPNDEGTWAWLCELCLKDCINDFWLKISDIDRHRFKESRHILLMYWAARMQHDLEPVYGSRRLFDDAASSLNENMFIIAFGRNAYSASKYFWELLEEYQKKRTIANICEKIDDPILQRFKNLFFSEKGISSNLLIFFLKQLYCYRFDAIRIKILGSSFMLDRFMEWPHETLFMKMFKEFWIHHDSIDYGRVISRLVMRLYFCFVCHLSIQSVKCHRIIYEIWEMNPKNLKNSIDYSKILVLLWRAEEIKVLNHILRDKELSGRRREFLNEIVKIYDSRTKSVFLETFITKVLVSEEEREWFKGRIALASQ